MCGEVSSVVVGAAAADEEAEERQAKGGTGGEVIDSHQGRQAGRQAAATQMGCRVDWTTTHIEENTRFYSSRYTELKCENIIPVYVAVLLGPEPAAPCMPCSRGGWILYQLLLLLSL